MPAVGVGENFFRRKIPHIIGDKKARPRYEKENRSIYSCFHEKIDAIALEKPFSFLSTRVGIMS